MNSDWSLYDAIQGVQKPRQLKPHVYRSDLNRVVKEAQEQQPYDASNVQFIWTLDEAILRADLTAAGRSMHHLNALVVACKANLRKRLVYKFDNIWCISIPPERGRNPNRPLERVVVAQSEGATPRDRSAFRLLRYFPDHGTDETTDPYLLYLNLLCMKWRTCAPHGYYDEYLE